MIEVVRGKTRLHVGEDIAYDFWRRNVYSLCGRFLGDVPEGQKGELPSCAQCKHILKGLL